MGQVSVWRDAKEIYSANIDDLHQVWDSVSWRICKSRDNPECADAEHAKKMDTHTPGLHVFLPKTFEQSRAAPKTSSLLLSKPKIAILREQGVNSHVEMAYAFALAGFESVDVHMTDLQNSRLSLKEFSGLVAVSYTHLTLPTKRIV